MAAVAYLAAHPELPRPTIRVGFTPDEEVGAGREALRPRARSARDCAYTLDGSEAGEFTDETFTAASADVRIRGVDVHPGFATGKLVNATRLAGRDPRRAAARAHPGGDRRPRGVHPRLLGRGLGRRGDDPHDRARLRRRPARRATSRCSARSPRTSWRPSRARTSRSRSSRSTRTCGRSSTQRPEVAAAAEEALRREGFEPRRVPIRGGTDGSILQRARAPDPEPVHRRPRVPLGARVGVGAGHGVGRRRRGAARGRVGRARVSRGEFGELIAATGELTVVRDRERPSGRLLRLGGMDASYVDLADPRHLEFDYLRRMRALVRAAGARRVVHVGGAGCALARALAAEHPDHRQEVIELDAAVVEVAREHLGLRRAPGLQGARRGRAGDARRAAGRIGRRRADRRVRRRARPAPPRDRRGAGGARARRRAGGGERRRRARHGRREGDRRRAAGGVPARAGARSRPGAGAPPVAAT